MRGSLFIQILRGQEQVACQTLRRRQGSKNNEQDQYLGSILLLPSTTMEAVEIETHL